MIKILNNKSNVTVKCNSNSIMWHWPGALSRQLIVHRGHNWYCKGGGVCVFIRSVLAFDTPYNLQHDETEYIWTEIL